jgi:hypothetical protein
MSILMTLGYSGTPKLTGENGSEIKSLSYDDLNPHARYVINKILRNINEQFWDPTRDNVTVFENKMKDLPAGGTYKEFTVLATDASYSQTYNDMAATVVPAPGIPGGAKARKAAKSVKDKGDEAVALGGGDLPAFASGMMRIVYDSANKRYFYTPTHYVGFSDSSVVPAVYYNPFFLVTDIDPNNAKKYGPGF